ARNPALFFATIGTLPRLSYVIWLFAPLAFLPLFSGRAFLLLVPGLLENLLTTNQFQFSTFYQYDAVLIPGMMYAAVYGLRNVTYRWPMRARFARKALVAGIIVGFFVRSPINPFTFPFELFGANARAEAFRKMSRDIPAGASVAAQTNILPHLANREAVFMLGDEKAPVDVVLIDAADAFGFSDDETFRAYIDGYANSGLYTTTVIGDRYVTMRRIP
ncbi:MAG: DUF2079 domain-containing protein, partial [Candidatus Harrisonbacteria bacterium]|nr:DUF2079 domain-containing protein [Candidatus Harrisonbacteria bacterium]